MGSEACLLWQLRDLRGSCPRAARSACQSRGFGGCDQCHRLLPLFFGRLTARTGKNWTMVYGGLRPEKRRHLCRRVQDGRWRNVMLAQSAHARSMTIAKPRGLNLEMEF
jgi:hypothetical protein